jgi:hypothetical protein
MYRSAGARALPQPERGGYKHLVRIAQALGAPYLGAAKLDAYVGSFLVTIGLEVNSGSVVGMTIRVPCGPFPDVKLRAETDSDRAGKARQIAAEVQTGDAHFDARIYIESDAFDDAVRAVLSRPDARAAILDLVAGAQTITFDAEGILLSISADDKADGPAFDPTRLRPILDRLVTIAETPAVRDGGLRKERRGVWLPLVGATIFAPLGIASCVLGFHAYDPTAIYPCVLGVLLFLGVWVGTRGLVGRAVAGDSRSFGRYRLTLFVLFVNAIEWGIAAPVMANGIADSSVASTAQGTVTSANHDSEDDVTHVSIRWFDGTTSSHTMTGNVDVGLHASGKRHPGALGIPWFEHGSVTVP